MESLEGFSYLGVSGLIFLVLFLKHIFFENKNIIFEPRSLLLITIIILFLSLSNNITFGDATIINYPLNKYFYALTSLIQVLVEGWFGPFIISYLLLVLFLYMYYFQKKILLYYQYYYHFNYLTYLGGLKHYFNGNQYKVSSEGNIY